MAEDEKSSELTQNATMRVDVAVLKEKVGNIDKKLDTIALQLTTNFVSKTEWLSTVEDVKALKSIQGWIVKLVVGSVLIAVLGLVLVKGGVPHQ